MLKELYKEVQGIVYKSRNEYYLHLWELSDWDQEGMICLHELISREEGLVEEAFDSLVRLRPTRLQAARDLFLIHHELLVLDKVAADREKSRRPLTTLFTDGRSARALLASTTCMFFQQVSRYHQRRP